MTIVAQGFLLLLAVATTFMGLAAVLDEKRARVTVPLLISAMALWGGFAAARMWLP